MLYIICEGQRFDREFSWHVGEQVPISHNDVQLVKEVQADGDELLRIKNTMQGIPMVSKPVVRWFGDDAKFIVAHL